MYLAKYTEKILKFTEAEQGLDGVNSSCKNVDRFFSLVISGYDGFVFSLFE